MRASEALELSEKHQGASGALESVYRDVSLAAEGGRTAIDVYVREELAGEVALRLQKQGYTVEREGRWLKVSWDDPQPVHKPDGSHWHRTDTRVTVKLAPETGTVKFSDPEGEDTINIPRHFLPQLFVMLQNLLNAVGAHEGVEKAEAMPAQVVMDILSGQARVVVDEDGTGWSVEKSPRLGEVLSSVLRNAATADCGNPHCEACRARRQAQERPVN